VSEKCEQCGKALRKPWLEKTGGELLCRDCFNGSTSCDDCGKTLPCRQTVTLKQHTMCRECMLKDELPVEVTLVRSNWAPWSEQEVIPVGDLLYPDLTGRKSRRVQAAVHPSAGVAVKGAVG